MVFWDRDHQMQDQIPLRSHLFTYYLFLFSSYNSELSTCDRRLVACEGTAEWSARGILQLTPAVDVSNCH